MAVSEGGYDEDLIWTTSDPAVAMVQDGLITAVSAGTAAITVSAEGVTDSCNVIVLDHPSGLVLPKALTEIEEYTFRGGEFQYVRVSDNARTIGDLAFAGNDSLLFVYIPESVDLFGTDIFTGSENVRIFGKEGSPAMKYCLENAIPFTSIGQ